MDAFISNFGYTDDTAARVSGFGADDDMERGIAKLEVMLATGAITQNYFDRECTAFRMRVQERETRARTSAEREANKALALAARTKKEGQERRVQAQALRAAEQERLRQIDYQRRVQGHAAAKGRGRVAGAPADCLSTARSILRQPGRSDAMEARKWARRGLERVRASGRHDLEGGALLLLAEVEDRLGQEGVAAALRYESAALQRRAPARFSSTLRGGLEERDGYAMAELRALALFQGAGQRTEPQSHGRQQQEAHDRTPAAATPMAGGLGAAVSAFKESGDESLLPDNATARGLLRAESKLRGLLSPEPEPEPQPSVWEELAQVQYDRINSRVPPALSPKQRQLAKAYGSGSDAGALENSSRRRGKRKDSSSSPTRQGGGGRSLTPSSPGPLRPLEASEVLRLLGEGGPPHGDKVKFTGSEWLAARRHARTMEPLCPFEKGPSGLCRLCHRKKRHSNHRPRTPGPEQPTQHTVTITSVRNCSPFRTELMRMQQQLGAAAAAPLAEMQQRLPGHTKQLMAAAVTAGGEAQGVLFAPSAARVDESITVLHTKAELAARERAEEAAEEARHGLGPNGRRPAPLPPPPPPLAPAAKHILQEKVPGADVVTGSGGNAAAIEHSRGPAEVGGIGPGRAEDKLSDHEQGANPKFETAVDAVTAAQNELAAVMQSQWDQQWIGLKRSLPTSIGLSAAKEVAQEAAQVAALRQREARQIQSAWDKATFQAERERLEAEAKQREREAVRARARALEAEAEAAQLQAERELERVRVARQQEKTERERRWHSETTSGFEMGLDGYGFLGHGGGVVMRDGSVRPLREVLQQRQVLEGRHWAGHGH